MSWTPKIPKSVKIQIGSDCFYLKNDQVPFEEFLVDTSKENWDEEKEKGVKKLAEYLWYYLSPRSIQTLISSLEKELEARRKELANDQVNH